MDVNRDEVLANFQVKKRLPDNSHSRTPSKPLNFCPQGITGLEFEESIEYLENADWDLLVSHSSWPSSSNHSSFALSHRLPSNGPIHSCKMMRWWAPVANPVHLIRG